MLPEKYIIGAGPAAPAADPPKDPPADPPKNDPPPSTPDQAAQEVAKAYGKLREREDELKTVKQQLKDKDTQLSEMDTVKNENTSLKEQNDKLTTQLQDFAVSGTARELGYVAPKFALGILQQSGKLKPEEMSDPAKVKAALTDIANENPGLVNGTVAPPGPSGGPINPGQGGNNAGGSAGFNNIIRRSAGRA